MVDSKCANYSKGVFLILAGCVLLLYAFGLLNKEFIILAIALYLITLGLVQIGGAEKIKGYLKKDK